MKKLTSSKAKAYAKRLYDLEQQMNKCDDKKEMESIAIKINDIVDEVVEIYEDIAMYKIDEEVYKLDKKYRENKI